MPDDDKQLLVPITVQALVVDDRVVQVGARLVQGADRNSAADGKWSPLECNYAYVPTQLTSPGPGLFFNAQKGQNTDNELVVGKGSSADPKESHRGVYVRWLLPPGLRRAHRPGRPDFPALPDQWLIVRFSRGRSTDKPIPRAWFLDGGVPAAGTTGSKNLLVPDKSGALVARRFGKSVPLPAYKPADFASTERTIITAVGNPTTGSPTFTASIAENRNILSWFDDLADLREPAGTGAVPQGTALSYLVLGWYREAAHEPLAAVARMLPRPPFVDLDLSFKDVLDRGPTSAADRDRVRDAFERNGVSLPPGVQVAIARPGERWSVTGPGGAGPSYTVTRDGDRLRVSLVWPITLDPSAEGMLDRRPDPDCAGLQRDLWDRGVRLLPRFKVEKLEPERPSDPVRWLITDSDPDPDSGANAAAMPAPVYRVTKTGQGALEIEFHEPSYVAAALGWEAGPAARLDGLLEKSCLFHGMVAHINYWDRESYKGPMLGYPGAPPAWEGLSRAPQPFKVGVGNNLEDALVALVASEGKLPKEAPDLSKALEAVLYRQIKTLVEGWHESPRDLVVHQTWFESWDGGKIWTIRPLESKGPWAPGANRPGAPGKTPRPTPEQLRRLKEINDAQVEADAIARELLALQQDLYARWFKLLTLDEDDRDSGEKDCQALMTRARALQDRLAKLAADLADSPGKLQAELEKAGLELRADSSPRFWAPSDPVLVVKHCGSMSKHAAQGRLPCRGLDGVVTAAEVTLAGTTEKFPAAGTDPARAITTLLLQNFPARGDALTRLVQEAFVVEQAVTNLARRSRDAFLAKWSLDRFRSRDEWSSWKDRLDQLLSQDGTVRFQVACPPARLVGLWGEQPWSPLYLDWRVTWYPTSPGPADFGPSWRLGDHDYHPAPGAAPPTSKPGHSSSGRSQLAPVLGRALEEPIQALRKLLEPHPEAAAAAGDALSDRRVREILDRYQLVWDEPLRELKESGLLGQALTGLCQTFLGRDVTLPWARPNPDRPWGRGLKQGFQDRDVADLLAPPRPAAGWPAVNIGWLAPPKKDKDVPFSPIRAGVLTFQQLWLVDDFGQWVDLLHGSSYQGATGQVFNPRVRWDGHPVLAMPPRLAQPARLNFRFVAASQAPVESGSDPDSSPICGWVFYNPQDEALAVCDPAGRLLGELALGHHPTGGSTVRWEPNLAVKKTDTGASPTDPAADFAGMLSGPSLPTRNGAALADLAAFARGLIQETPANPSRLEQLLELIDAALERIRPAVARREGVVFGRPLALVSARLGLELYGKAWTDPLQPVPADGPARGTGDPMLDKLQVPVRLGCAHNVEDGLVGYYRNRQFDRIVPTELPETRQPQGDYLADRDKDATLVGFTAAEPLHLLMDPRGSVLAGVGILPAKSIALDRPELDAILARMEVSLRVGPVLLPPGRPMLPTPAGEHGRWHLHRVDPAGPATAEPVAPFDSRSRPESPCAAAEGRLVLVRDEPQTP